MNIVVVATFEGAVLWQDWDRALKIFQQYPVACCSSPLIKELHNNLPVEKANEKHQIAMHMWGN